MSTQMHRPYGLAYDYQSYKAKEMKLDQVADEMPTAKMVRIYDHRGKSVDGFMGVKIADRITAVHSPKFKLVTHADMFKAVHDELSAYQEDYDVLKVWGNDNHRLAEIIINQPFTMKEIEKLGKDADRYVPDRLTDDPNTYYPGLIVGSNYVGYSNMISFNIYRGICTNGMMWGELLQKLITVRHLNKSVKNFFSDKLNEFMQKIFADRLTDRIFKQYEVAIKTTEFQEFLESELGKRRIASRIKNDPKFAKFMVQKTVSAYAAYQLLTFMMSNEDLGFGRRLGQQQIANRFNHKFL